MKKAVLFDLDGVITDTAELHYFAWKKLAQEIGLKFDRKINEKLKGVSRRDSFLIIAGEKKFSDQEIQKILKIKNSYYVESILSTYLSPLPGITDLMEYLKKKDIRVTVASSSCNADLILKALKPSLEFDAIVSGKDISNSKPHPEVFLMAAERCNVVPELCVVIEDAYAGVLAAKNADMTVIAVGDNPDLSTADYIVTATNELMQIIPSLVEG